MPDGLSIFQRALSEGVCDDLAASSLFHLRLRVRLSHPRYVSWIRKSGSLHSGGQRLDEPGGKSNERPARLQLPSAGVEVVTDHHYEPPT